MTLCGKTLWPRIIILSMLLLMSVLLAEMLSLMFRFCKLMSFCTTRFNVRNKIILMNFCGDFRLDWKKVKCKNSDHPALTFAGSLRRWFEHSACRLMFKQLPRYPANVNAWKSPPYENVHVGFFIHTSRKREKKSTVNSYNLISCHFNTKSKVNSHKIKQNSIWTESARINLPTAMAECLFNFELPSLKEFETPK